MGRHARQLVTRPSAVAARLGSWTVDPASCGQRSPGRPGDLRAAARSERVCFHEVPEVVEIVLELSLRHLHHEWLGELEEPARLPLDGLPTRVPSATGSNTTVAVIGNGFVIV